MCVYIYLCGALGDCNYFIVVQNYTKSTGNVEVYCIRVSNRTRKRKKCYKNPGNFSMRNVSSQVFKCGTRKKYIYRLIVTSAICLTIYRSRFFLIFHINPRYRIAMPMCLIAFYRWVWLVLV